MYVPDDVSVLFARIVCKLFSRLKQLCFLEREIGEGGIIAGSVGGVEAVVQGVHGLVYTINNRSCSSGGTWPSVHSQ